MLTLVQISDIHFRSDYTNINRAKKLLIDLQTELPKGERALLLITGDIAHTGTSNEYESFMQNFLFDSIDMFSGIVMCPGNHDIERHLNDHDLIDRIAKDKAKLYLYDKSGRLNLECPFMESNLPNYESFERLITSPTIRNFYGSRHEFPEATIVSLNTAWLSRRREHEDTDRGYLRVEKPVVEYFSQGSEPSKLKIAILHHPLDWITEDSRQDVENVLTSNFDLVLSGHCHSPSAVCGTFTGGECFMHQAPSVQTKDGRGSNAYSIIRIAQEEKRIQVRYRTYSVTQDKFIEGSDICNNGVYYPSANDQMYWDRRSTTVSSEILRHCRAKLTEIDFSDWTLKNTPQKTKAILKPIEPHFRQMRFQDGERIDLPRTPLREVIRDLPAELFIIGPADSGLSTAANQTVQHIIANLEQYGKIPLYLNISAIAVNRASILSEASKSSPFPLNHRQIEALSDSGEIIFIVDGLKLPDNKKFNHVREVATKYFSNCKFIYLCSTDGSPTAVTEDIELHLVPSSDVVYLIDQLESSCIRELVALHFTERSMEARQAIVDHIIQSFRAMDEPIYASTVVLLIDTIRQIPDFQPINKVRLLDRYVEVLLGRLDLEDIRTGSFSSTDKLVLLSYLAGHFIRKNCHYLLKSDWAVFIDEYSAAKLLSVPSGLLEEFIFKGILLDRSGQITFRADYLFSYFVARAMHNDSQLRESILKTDLFFSCYREIAAYGELENVDNVDLIQLVRDRLEIIEEKVLESYSKEGVDLDSELVLLFEDLNVEDSLEELNGTASTLNDLPNIDEPDEDHLNDELKRIPRKRGILPRTEVRYLESRWLNTLLTFLRLLKHSENLMGSTKLSHIECALENGELFVKTLAYKKDIIAQQPAAVIDGILYLNPLAAFDLKKSVAEFKYSAPSSFARVLGETISNPKLSPVFRKLSGNGSDLRRYFVRRMLLDHSEEENRKAYCTDLTSSTEIVLQTCSLRELKRDYVTQGYIKPRREYLKSVVDSLANSQKIAGLFSKKEWERRQQLDRMKRASKGKTGRSV
jgi:predicted MPP superfamily phosphohydrolase